DAAEYDEDDHDVARVRVVDLALYKQVDTSMSIFPEMFGSQVKFDIIVVNQGNVPSDSVVIEDYLPEGYGFDWMDANNVAEGWGSDLTITQEGRLEFGESDTVCLYTTLENVIVPMEASWWNYAEITEVYDTTGVEIGGDDMDSEPGSDSEEERSVSLESEGDDDISSTGREDVGSEDDHDVAGVRFLDLALYKQVDSIETTFPVAYGDLIKFDLIAVSQEGVTVDSIRVRDYIPEGYTFDPNIPENAALNWQTDTTAVITGPFAVGDTMHTSIYLTLEQISVPTDRSWVNYSEIANAWMGGMDIAGMDIDSRPDSDSPEERAIYPGLTGDDDIESITRDGIGSEDDHDPAHVEVFDLALRKTTNATVGKVGDDITFTIDIYNQGSIAATNIEISDYINAGYSFNGFLNPGWQNTNNTVTTVLEDTLYAGENTSVQLVLTVTNEYDPEAMINRAEVSMAMDTSGMEREDIDGMFDQDQFNDAGGLSESPADDYVDGDGTGNINDGDAQGDEDNADPEYVIPCPPVNCYGSLFLSFDMNCEIIVTPDMLLVENGLARKNPEFYEVVLTYGNGIVIPNNILYKNHVGKDITARVTFLLDACGGGACETTINLEKPDGCLIGNTLDTIVYCIDPFLELDPEDASYPKPEAMQPCEEDPLT
ncbi:DUF11 domain-containing protein, partial [Membranihabitans maritimus]|uniref:DUF11 domain-containing protein n=1 Tax=Membranihabitans maritimus TaxID=2904244 RepID=UPI001F231AA7